MIDITKLAFEGGEPTRTDEFAPWPYFDEELIEAVSEVLRSGKVNYWSGQQGRKFEREYAAFVGTNHAVAVANGTLALELALAGLGVAQGDEVIVPSRTFIASASAVVMRGATPVICDIDSRSQNLTAETIRPHLTPRTKAIIAVHLAGWPCDMDPIMALARQHNLKVIEDCAQAHGATYKGRPIGGIGELGCFSFCQDKILTTGGEGGMVVMNDRDLWNRCWSFKDHGKDWDAVYNTPGPSVFKFVHEDFGTNWRITEMQSAIGRIILQRLPGWVEKRRVNAALLEQGLSQIDGITVPSPTKEFGHSYYKFYAFIDSARLGPEWTRDQVLRALQAEGILCGSGSCGEIYLEKAFSKHGIAPLKPLPVARKLSESSLMFVVHPTLGLQEMEDTCRAVRKVLQHAFAGSSSKPAKAA
ncbi:MAG: DegT/DnrJ/EryC1/StrS aminotransferase family protein [Planctomycetes bacterium]|nr:DegT/DnrJ/EryC1/StrS aminotransferase family protein [Planctomycetota bacterium]